MAFVIVIMIVGFVALITGGRIQNLKNISFRHSWLVFVAVAIKIITNSNLRLVIGIPDSLGQKLYIISLFLVAVFVLLNMHLRGLFLVGLGLISNLTAIVFNSGYMPVKIEYLNLVSTPEELVKISQGLPLYNHIAAGPSTKFFFLSDIFLMPHWILITRVFSIGDVILTIGGAIFIWTSIKPNISARKSGLSI
ncbi:DUF5317 domain-containing protein [Pelotomaculum propionicicum]|uniref:DUF5317 domain-containing protein n=1 Tax=Pelotomaculum propionicicum TaxID=258475 RepID=A0A4Y7RJM9_9FIRM|nr:DUF5317 domain-containing protein [Pelotomaculum propionicicum]NLI12202.1 DUF5317 domain-containing protein [Peptococcaceae bacterium]TEB09011.1 hypothetical protein Pmgp_03459 [Pelotomaculum propionicicum]